MVKYRLIRHPEGQSIEGPTGSIPVLAEPNEPDGDIIIHTPGEHDSVSLKGQCAVTGDTYNQKDKIKKLEYGEDGTRWNGDVWTVNEEASSDLAAVLMVAGISVSVYEGALRHDAGWGRYYEPVDESGCDGEEMVVMVGPDYPTDFVSRSWVQEAAKVGGFQEVENFIEKFGLTVVDDGEAYNRAGLSDDDPEVSYE